MERLRERLRVPLARFWLLLLVPAVALSLGGSREPWVLGLIILLIGACVALRPPTVSIPTLIWLPALCFLLVSLGGFLPRSWSQTPAWRLALEEDHGLAGGDLVTPQPAITLESWLLLAIGMFWALACVGQAFGSRERRMCAHVIVFLSTILAMVSLGLQWTGREIPFWRLDWSLAYFGPFPNRNHFGSLLAIGAVLSFASAQDSFRRRGYSWILFTLCVVPLFAATLINTSRMGFLLFFGGIALWLVVGAAKRRTVSHAAIAVSVLLALASAFMIFGGKIMDRFQQSGGMLKTLSEEGRLAIYTDTARLIGASPWLGIGMGNFEPVFAITRLSSETESRALHPESDWLWLAAECGLPAVLLAMVALVGLILKIGAFRSRRSIQRFSKPMRVAAGVSMMILLLQSLVDTPLHSMGLATLGGLLAGLAIKPGTPKTGQAWLWSWRASGIILGIWGAAALYTSLPGSGVATALPGNSRYRLLARDAVRLGYAGDRAGALQAWDKAARYKPLQWDLYFNRAALKLHLGRSSREAVADFNRARTLERNNGRMCMAEAYLWLKFDPPYALPALREAIERDTTRALNFYGDLAGQLRHHPGLRSGIRSLATTPKFLYVYLGTLSEKAVFTTTLHEFLDAYPDLSGLNASERLELFRWWYARGDVGEFLDRVPKNYNWMKDAWPVLAAHHAQSGSFLEAFDLAKTHAKPPPALPKSAGSDVEQLRRLYNLDPRDSMAALALAVALRQQHQNDQALELLDDIISRPDVPARALYEKAWILAEKGDYRGAWETIQQYESRAGK